MLTFKHILCPVDFSDTSNHALHAAIELAVQLNADLHLIHVYQYPAFTMPETDMAIPVDISLQDEYRQRLEDKLQKHAAENTTEALALSSSLLEGIPYQEIVNAAEKLNSDLIVMGTHGRSGLAHMLLGSVTERVVRTAKIPVLSVPIKTS